MCECVNVCMCVCSSLDVRGFVLQRVSAYVCKCSMSECMSMDVGMSGVCIHVSVSVYLYGMYRMY